MQKLRKKRRQVQSNQAWLNLDDSMFSSKDPKTKLPLSSSKKRRKNRKKRRKNCK